MAASGKILDDVGNLIFGFVLIVAAVVMLLTGSVRLCFATLQIRRTNPVGCEIAEGRVISREINRTSGGESAKFTLNVRYEYVALGIRKESQFNHKSQDIRERDSLASLYQPERKIRVHYDPSDPDRCWLNYDERTRARDKLESGSISTLLGMFILAVALIGFRVTRYFEDLNSPAYPYVWIAIGLALILSLVFLLGAIANFHLIQPRDWVTSEGRVISVRPSDYSLEEGMVYELVVLYEYIVEGIEIRSQYSRSFVTKSERDRIASLYQHDRKIIVHYDPNDPSISWIKSSESEVPQPIVIASMMLLAAVLMIAFAVFLAYRRLI